MKALGTDRAVLEAAFARVTDWDGWYAFERTWFDWSRAPERPDDAIARDLDRPPVSLEGNLWEPLAGQYDVPSEIEILYERYRAAAFARLDPDAHRDNLAHSGRYAMKCVACRVYTRQPAAACPFCGRPLLSMPLNKD